MKKLFVLCLLTTGSLFAQNKTTKSTNLETITLAGGCYWCVEAVYENLNGVQSAVSAYAGGKNVNPTYEDVSTGKSGYAEVVQITYDKNATNLDEIFKVFFIVHDPSTLNRQGADVGTQYRSAIFYKNEAQKNNDATAIKRHNCLITCTKNEKTRLEKVKAEHIKIINQYKNDDEKRDEKINQLMETQGQPKPCNC